MLKIWFIWPAAESCSCLLQNSRGWGFLFFSEFVSLPRANTWEMIFESFFRFFLCVSRMFLANHANGLITPLRNSIKLAVREQLSVLMKPKNSPRELNWINREFLISVLAVKPFLHAWDLARFELLSDVWRGTPFEIGYTKFNFPIWLSARTFFQSVLVATLFLFQQGVVCSPLTVGRKTCFPQPAYIPIFFQTLFHKAIGLRWPGELEIHIQKEERWRGRTEMQSDRQSAQRAELENCACLLTDGLGQARTEQNVSSHLPVFIRYVEWAGNCILFLI